jgi:AAA domain
LSAVACAVKADGGKDVAILVDAWVAFMNLTTMVEGLSQRGEQWKLKSITALSRGATFFRGDLHIHSYGASYDVSDATATPSNIIDAAIAENLHIIALTDHNEISNIRDALKLEVRNGLLVVPAVELSTPEGHLLCYAPAADALERFFNRLSIADRRTKNCRCQTGTVECLNLLQDEGGFAVLAHVELAGAFESIMPRSTPAKLDILCHPALAGIEVTSADCPILYTDQDSDNDRRSAALQRISNLGLGSQQFLARILNSDGHTLTAIGRNAKNDRRITRYKMDSPTFDGLRLAFEAPDTRVRIEDEVPSTVPIIQGIHFSGGFLDNQAIHFSPNLTCIIGGRGSGKSTAFEGVRLISGNSSPEVVPVIDTDVWADMISLVYCDETSQSHALGRSKFSELENIDDPVTGPTSFPIESYRQGETNDISKRVQDDPLALLTFLDRLVAVDEAIDREDEIRGKLNELAPKLEKARLNVAKISSYEAELKLKQGQVARLKKDKGEDIIRLQQRLEGERRALTAVEASLTQLASAITRDAVIAITESIKENVGNSIIELGAPEAAQIRSDTASYETAVAGSTDALKKVTSAYIASVRAQIVAWKTKGLQTANEIDAKKKELLSHGIRLDMPFIQKLVFDEARTAENLRNLRTWVPELARLRKEHSDLLRERWAALDQVATLRTAFAIRASRALKGTLSVTVKFDVSSLSPDAERLLIDAMGWRTLQQLKAAAVITQLTLPTLLDCVKRKSAAAIMALRNANEGSIFAQNEAEILLERLSDPDLLAQLESVAVYDLPKLTVTKRIDSPGGAPRYARIQAVIARSTAIGSARVDANE